MAAQVWQKEVGQEEVGEVGDRELDLEAVTAQGALRGEDRGVVHQSVQGVPEIDDGAGARAHRFQARQVGDDEVVLCAAGESGEGIQGVAATLLIPAYQDDSMPVRGEMTGSREADSAVGAGDGDGLHGGWVFGSTLCRAAEATGALP